MMHKFLIVIEQIKKNFSAYCPDLPGCIATGKTREQAKKNIYDAIKMHLEGLSEDRKPIPRSRAISEYIVVK